MLSTAWQDWRDPRVGLALAELQERRGQLRQSTATRASLIASAAQAPAGGAAPVDAAPRALPVSVGAAAGFGWFSRSGVVGTSQLTGHTIPVAAAVGLPGVWQLELQAVPHRLDNGETQTLGTTLSVGLASRPGAPLAARARVGTGPLGSGEPGRWTWDGTASAALGDRGEAAVGFHRAPVLETLAAWSGAGDVLDRPYGAVADTWVSGQLSLRWAPATDLGAVVRAGAMAGPDVAPIAWQQLAAWAHRPLLPREERVRVGVEGLVMAHDHSSDRFTGGEAGAYTPTRFGQVSGRIEGAWRHPARPLQVCGSAGAGPQYQDGQTLRFQDPGWALNGDAAVAAQWRFAADWLAEGRVYAQGTSTRWHQQVALITVQRLAQAAAPLPPAAPFASPVHSPPLVPHRPCGTVSWEVTP